MEIWYLDSRNLYGISSVNNYEQIVKQLIAASPFWEKDGGGIRGRTLAPLIGGASGPNLMGDPPPQQFNVQRSRISQQQDDPLPELSLPSSGGTTSISHPFKISFTSSDSISVNAGTVNNVVAGNWDQVFTISGTSASYVILTVNAAANRVVSSVMSVQGSPPAAEESPVKWGVPSTFQILIGIILNNNIFQIVFNNLSYNALKRITTDRQNPQAGLLPYDNWYTWVKISG